LVQISVNLAHGIGPTGQDAGMVEQPFRGSVAIAAGVVTAAELRGPRFQRLFPDVYVPATDGPIDLVTRSRAAHLLVEHRGGALGGYSAAALLGADCAPPGTPAEVIVAGAQRRHPGLRPHRGAIVSADLRRVKGCLLTSPERTAWDMLRRQPLVEAVVALDALAGLKCPDDERVTWDGLRRRREHEPGGRGCRQLEQMLALADPRAESAMETRLRMLLVQAGLPVPEVQFELVDEWGFVVARFDLAYPEHLLAIEYDGRGHVRREYSFDDRWRDGTTGDHGWHTMRFGYDDVMLTHRRTARLVRNRLERTHQARRAS
jgi:very-short-patch-repair endonuclease